MVEIKNLYEKRARVYNQMKDVTRKWKDQAEKNEEINKDEERQFDLWDKEFTSLTEQIQRLEKINKIDAADVAESEKNNDPPEKRDYKAEYREAFRKYAIGGLRGINEKEADLLQRGWQNYDEKRAATPASTTTTAGGYTIPEDFSYEVEKFMAYMGPFGQPAGPFAPYRSWVSETGADLPWPTVDDTANSGELLAESGDATTNSTGVTFGIETLKAYAMSSNLIPVTRQILQDSGVQFVSLLGELLGERLGRIKNSYCTTGTGSSEPEGVVIGASSGKVAASSSAFTIEEMIDLIYSVNKAYRGNPKTAFMFHSSICGYIRKKDFSTSNYTQPLWTPSVREGQPDRVLGYPYFENDNMDSAFTTGKKLVLFGDFNKYVIRTVRGIEFFRSEERYIEKLQIAWLAWMRFDSRVMNTNALKYLELT